MRYSGCCVKGPSAPWVTSAGAFHSGYAAHALRAFSAVTE